MVEGRSGRRGWRPGPDTAIALASMVIAAGGVGWAATRDATSPQSISACANKATGVLRLNTGGTCDPAGETALDWSQQGPQGAPGAPGADATVAPAVVAQVTQHFKNTFFVSMSITTPGTYLVEGTVAARVTSTAKWHHKAVLNCRLLQYPTARTPGPVCWRRSRSSSRTPGRRAS